MAHPRNSGLKFLQQQTHDNQCYECAINVGENGEPLIEDDAGISNCKSLFESKRVTPGLRQFLRICRMRIWV